MRQRVGKWLTVEDLSIPERKTRVWVVEGSDGSPLGQVRWYGQWRCYAFMPTSVSGIVMNATCLADLAEFMKARTTEYMGALRT